MPLFPFSYNRITQLWSELLKKSGQYERDSTTKRCTTTLHSLRRFFINQSRQNMPKDISDLIVGHVTDLDRVYFQPTTEDLAEHYKKAIPNLSIEEGVSQELMEEFKTEIEKRDIRINQLEIKFKKLLRTVKEIDVENEKFAEEGPILDDLATMHRKRLIDTIKKIEEGNE